MDLHQEVFKLKQILRRGLVLKNIPGRIESVADHVFSAILLSLEIMAKNNLNLNVLKVLKMIAYHDLGEIDVGDITIHDNVGKEEKYQKELLAVTRLSKDYDMPEILSLWKEFEEGSTKEAKFVRLIDRYECCLNVKAIKEQLGLTEAFDEFTNYYECEYTEGNKFIRSDFYYEIYKLKKVLRRGMILRNIPNRTESDSEHCFSMMIFALELLHKNDLSLDELKVLKMIAYHELGEVYVGDITIVDNVSKEEKYLKEKKAIEKISKEADMPEIENLWLEFEENKTNEAKFVKMVDKCDGVKQCKIYADIYNRPEIYDEWLINNNKWMEELKKYNY